MMAGIRSGSGLPASKKNENRSRKRNASTTTSAATVSKHHEVMKVALDRLQTFIESSDETTLIFPATLNNAQRAYIHKYVLKRGLTSRSHGKGESRYLTVYKPSQQHMMTGHDEPIQTLFTNESFQVANEILDRLEPMPIRPAARRVQMRAPAHSTSGSSTSPFSCKLCLRHIPPQVVFATHRTRIDRERLPIWKMREQILDSIENNQVVVLSGETGSGKSTQVPQYILETAWARREPCRIICTQPRRLAAIALADRVSFERGEKLGHTVGYHIRFENKFNATTNLIYMTSGCFLRLITNDTNQTFQGITHILMDEIHERDKNTDFALIALRDQLSVNPRLKVTLMSATMNINLLRTYFRGSDVIQVPGFCYETRTFMLEDILSYLQYETPQMRATLQSIAKEKKPTPAANQNSPDSPDEQTRNFVDSLIELSLKSPDEKSFESFEQLVYLIEGEDVPVDMAHTATGFTPLMAAAMRNNVKYLNRFLKNGASPNRKDVNGKTAIDYAQLHGSISTCYDRLVDFTIPDDLNDDKMNLLRAYQLQQPDDAEEIDHDLLLTLLATIHKSSSPGSVLVFLAGFNDMMVQKDLIERNLKSDTYKIFLIHGSMNMHDQRQAFKRSRVRKLILATNIAEVSVTLPDVTYVIDTGRVKQNTYNSITQSSFLQSVDISKACAKQRAGRAGRTQTGICYRLYSSQKYKNFTDFPIAELLRVPLTEICLYTKVISKLESIAEYLGKAIEPPSRINVANSIQKLIAIGALETNEDLTILGKRLVEIPLDAQLGKCLLHAIVLRCLNPIITTIAYFTTKDPFLLPSDRADRGRVTSMRMELSENIISDHLGIIRMFQKWLKSRQLQTESRFLYDHNLSKASLETMVSAQKQLFDYVKRTAMPPNTTLDDLNVNSIHWNVIRACLTAGLYPNLAYVDQTNNRLKTKLEKSIAFHPSSVLCMSISKNERKTFKTLLTDWIIFNENSRIRDRSLIRYNTMVTPLDIALFCGGLTIEQYSSVEAERETPSPIGNAFVDCDNNDEPILLIIDEFVRFNVTTREYASLIQLKQRFLAIFVEFLHAGRHWSSAKHSNFLNSLKQILAIDSQKYFGIIAEPFNDSYLPERYDTLTNIKHFRIEKGKKSSKPT